MEQTPNPSFEEENWTANQPQSDFERWEQELQADPQLDFAALEQEFPNPPEETSEPAAPVEIYAPNAFLPNTAEGQAILEQYHEALNKELNHIDRELDNMKDKVSTEAQAEEWFELKTAVAATKNMKDNLGSKSDLVAEIKQATSELRHSLGTLV